MTGGPRLEQYFASEYRYVKAGIRKTLRFYAAGSTECQLLIRIVFQQ